MEVSFVTTFFLVKRESISYFRSGSVKTATDAKYRNQLTKQFASTLGKERLVAVANLYEVRNRIGSGNR